MNSLDPHRQNLKKCIELADYTLINNGTIEDLHRKAIEIITEIENKNA